MTGAGIGEERKDDDVKQKTVLGQKDLVDSEDRWRASTKEMRNVF